MGTDSKPQGQAMYVATKSERTWLLSEQRKLYQRSFENPDYVFRKLWGLITDFRNLRIAFARVARNEGRRSPGVDGITVRKVVSQGVDAFVANARVELRSGAYRPSPVRRVLIPKAGQLGKFRPLGIPTVKDRVVQAAVKNILEPIFEADFYPCSHGFRPGKSVHGALEQLRKSLRPANNGPAAGQLPYQWVIEGDIKGCFDHIDHHALMNRVRRRVSDAKVNRLIIAFLKSGIISEAQFHRSDSGTPQGGILSPLLANIALSAIEERYERHAWPRRAPRLATQYKTIARRAKWHRGYDRSRTVVRYPLRYADDFLILIGVPPGPNQFERAKEAAEKEKVALATFLKDTLCLELSETKTLITPVTKTMRFLGHNVRTRWHSTKRRYVGTAVIPKVQSQQLRTIIKRHLHRRTVKTSLADRLKLLTPKLRGWCNFYRHAWGAKHVFAQIDHYLWWTILRWLKHKHVRQSMKFLADRYGWKRPRGKTLRWQDGDVRPFVCAEVKVGRFKQEWQKIPSFALIYGEPGA